MSVKFPDHFSGHAASYARHRPHYPDALYQWIAQQAPAHVRGWDVATGSGQAARGLIDHFDEVIATDASAAQLSHATAQAPGLRFQQALAEDSGLPGGSVDAITVAAGLHWFDRERFFAEVRRVARPGACLVAWTYTATQQVDGHPQPAFLQQFVEETLGPHWPPQFFEIPGLYQPERFPFTAIPTPSFQAQEQWSLEAFIGHIQTWSGYARARTAMGVEPIALIREPLGAWWAGGTRTVTWDLFVYAGRVG
ncbi:MAG: class I SAM-dependent methyltransferase [Myxococcota bacterium]